MVTVNSLREKLHCCTWVILNFPTLFVYRVGGTNLSLLRLLLSISREIFHIAPGKNARESGLKLAYGYCSLYYCSYSWWVFQRLQIALVLQTRANLIVFEKLTGARLLKVTLKTILLPMQVSRYHYMQSSNMDFAFGHSMLLIN